MTSTPSTSSPQRLAGRFFGLNLADLFKDDNTEGSNGFEGFAPGFKVQQMSKGRGGVLSYKAPRQPTQMLSAEIMPAITKTAAETPAQTETPKIQTPEAPKSLAEMSAQDIFSNYSKYDQGEQGLFGGQDVDYLRGQGVGDETIREVARLSSGTQQTPAAVYARLGGTLTSPTPTASTQLNPQEYASGFAGSSRDVGQKGLFGGQDVDAMRNQGYTDEQIRATANAIRRSGQALPAAVFRRLGEF